MNLIRFALLRSSFSDLERHVTYDPNISYFLSEEIGARLIRSVEDQGYTIIDRFLSQHLLDAARDEYARCMCTTPLHAQGEKFRPSDLSVAPWRKQTVGSRSGSGEPYSQLLQTTYFHSGDQRFPALSGIFNSMVTLRNFLTGMPLDYGNNLQSDAFWNACRLHHYPQGGGHMATHLDTLFPKLLRDFKIPFIQIMVTLSARGKDFKTGGGFIIDRAGEKIFFENENNAGALVLFDGSIYHGVDDIDSFEFLDFSKINGRKALFVNLYKNLEMDEPL